MRSLRQKLAVFFGLLVVVICGALSVTAYTYAKNALKDSTEKSILEVAKQTANSITGMVDGELAELESIAARNDIKGSDVSIEEKVKVLKEEAERIECDRLTIIDMKGTAFNGNGETSNLAEREYYKKAMSGESYVSDPMASVRDEGMIVVYAVPIKDNDQIIGVLTKVKDGNDLSVLTNTVKYGEGGFAYLINKEGTAIAHPEQEVVTSMENVIKQAETDATYKGLAAAIKKAIEEKNGVTTYEYEGDTDYIGYAPVSGTDWTVVVDIGVNEILGELETLRLRTIVTSLLFILLGTAVAYYVAYRISKGIKESSKALDILAGGDLRLEVPEEYINNRDEVGDMTRAMQSMSQSLRSMIQGIKGNSLNIGAESENLSTAADEISSVSQNVAEAINDIARGTSSQSEDLMTISEILNEFGNKVIQIVNEIREVDKTSKDINEKANHSSDEMALLTESVANVGNVFNTFSEKIDLLGKNVTEINEITNVINGIAEQTNLLALNAAIEAARAGDAGKGFSVVAEEIRKLAEESQVSAEKISSLIMGISKETKTIVEESGAMDSELSKQEKVIKQSIESFNSIMQAIDDVLPKISTVEHSVENLNKEKDDILSRVESASSVSLEVSASAEEISASSEEMNASIEEMSGIAQSLKEMTKEMIDEVDEFKV